MAVLRVVQGHNEGEVIPLRGERVTLGRAPDRDVVIAFSIVSRNHAHLVRVGGEYSVEDQHSRNGTFVNNRRVEERVPLRNHDRIRICGFVAVYHDRPPFADVEEPGGSTGGVVLDPPRPMTEHEWRTGADPRPMLLFLGQSASERKLRLFACACCRRVWETLSDATNRQGVEAAERYADGDGTLEDLRAARLLVQHSGLRETTGVYHTLGEGRAFGRWGPAEAVWACQLKRNGDWEAVETERAAQAAICRDIFHPFAQPPLDPAWLAWEGGQVVSLARAAHAQRSLPDGELDETRLAVLADALEEAGCASAGWLDHLRGPGPHVRGCWAVDPLCQHGVNGR
jgi:hypothetical protein